MLKLRDNVLIADSSRNVLLATLPEKGMTVEGETYLSRDIRFYFTSSGSFSLFRSFF